MFAGGKENARQAATSHTEGPRVIFWSTDHKKIKLQILHSILRYSRKTQERGATGERGKSMQ